MSLVFNRNNPMFQLEALSSNENGTLAKLYLSAPKMNSHEYHVDFELYRALNENELDNLLTDVKEFMLAANAYIDKPDSM
jgi:hypothetical protein